MTYVFRARSKASDWAGMVGKGVTEKFPLEVKARKEVVSCWMAARAEDTLCWRYDVTVSMDSEMSENWANWESRVPRGKRYLPTAMACWAPLRTVPMRGPTLGARKLSPIERAVRISFKQPLVGCGGSSNATIAATLSVADERALLMAV